MNKQTGQKYNRNYGKISKSCQFIMLNVIIEIGGKEKQTKILLILKKILINFFEIMKVAKTLQALALHGNNH